MRSSRIAPLLVAVPLLLAGCGDTGSGGGTASGTTTTTSSTTTTTATATATTTASSGNAGSAGSAGCPSVGRQVPPGAVTKPTVDVDGDGRPDTAWIVDQTTTGGGVQFGVQTASGGDFSTTFDSASGQSDRSVLIADVTGKGEVVALASDGRQVQLSAISNCSFVPVQNPQGQQYTFDLGFSGYGTGVGCTDVDGNGTRDLVGLLATGSTIKDTIVELAGPKATNGASRTISDASQAQLDQARQVTCGDLTLAADGVGIGA